jgi:ubiquitin C-terminal hydrolase
LVAGEIISDYNCEACNKKVDLEKRLSIDKLPNTLIIHLQRITFDLDCLKNVKLNDRVEFPNVLNLKDFSSEEILKLEKM